MTNVGGMTNAERRGTVRADADVVRQEAVSLKIGRGPSPSPMNLVPSRFPFAIGIGGKTIVGVGLASRRAKIPDQHRDETAKMRFLFLEY
jgi:hypothetical protein